MPYLNSCERKAVIKISAPNQRQPVIEKCFDRFPIGDPTENDQALLDELTKFSVAQTARGELGRDEAKRKDRQPDQERRPSDTE